MLEFGDVVYRRILQQLLSSLVLVSCAAPALSCELSEPLGFNEIADGIYVHQGLHEDISEHNCGDIANVGFVVGEKSVAVIDPGGSPAVSRALLDSVKHTTDLPVSHVIITHFHPDHLLGVGQIAEGVAVVAHKNYLRAQTQRGQFYLERYANLFANEDVGRLVSPTDHVEEQTVIDLGRRVLRLNAHQTAHTDNDLTVFDVTSGVLWTGDLLFHERLPSLDGSVTGWLSVMDELAAMTPVLVVPGHGPVGTWEAIAPKQRQYLLSLRDEIRALISANGRLSEAVERVGKQEQKNWQLFNELHRGNVTRAFTELEWE